MDVFAEKRVGTRCAGRFDIKSVLGGGGMGTVYAAQHAFTGREVALKILHPEVASSPAARERFLREARAPSAIDHPGIVPVLDAGVADDGTLYLAFERLHGEDLGVALAHGAIDGDLLVSIAIDLLEALETAHVAGLIHRDIKPENVFLERTSGGEPPRVRLLDFGITRPALEPSDGSMTQTGTLIGTPDYLSPEQAQGHPVDQRADLFSVGGLLFYGLTRRRAFDGDTPLRRLVALLTTTAPSVRAVRPEIPEPLGAIVDRALAHDPAARFASAREMADALRAVERPVALPALAPVEAGGSALSGDPIPRVPTLVGGESAAPVVGASGTLTARGTRPSARRGGTGGGARPWLWGLAGAAVAGVAYTAAAVMDVLPREPAWHPAVNLEPEPDVSPSTTGGWSVARNPTRRETAVVWAESGAVKLRRREASGEWLPVQKLDRRGDPRDPRIGVDGAGRMLAVWALSPQDRDTEAGGIWYSRSEDGASWTEPERIWQGTTYGPVALAVAPSGLAAAVWTQAVDRTDTTLTRETGSLVHAATFDGQAWSDPRGLRTDTQRALDEDPQIAIDGRGRAVAAWIQGKRAWVTALGEGTAPEARPLSASSNDSEAEIALALNASGDGVATWVRRPESTSLDHELWAARYTTDSGMEVSKQIGRFGTISYPQPSIDAAGNVTVLYVQGSGDLVALARPAGEEWHEDPRPVASLAATYGGHLMRAAAAENGRIVAVWREALEAPGKRATQDGVWAAVWAVTRPATGAEWSAPVRVHAVDGAKPGLLEPGVDPTGGAVVWVYVSGAEPGLPMYQMHASVYE